MNDDFFGRFEIKKRDFNYSLTQALFTNLSAEV